MNPDDQLSPHFKRREFACKDNCGLMDPTTELVDALEALRALVGNPIIINDALRCPTHNAAVGGCAHSQHELGTAADIQVEGMTARELYAIAVQVPALKGFGVSQNSYIHVDVRMNPARWCYDANGKEIPWEA